MPLSFDFCHSLKFQIYENLIRYQSVSLLNGLSYDWMKKLMTFISLSAALLWGCLSCNGNFIIMDDLLFWSLVSEERALVAPTQDQFCKELTSHIPDKEVQNRYIDIKKAQNKLSCTSLPSSRSPSFSCSGKEISLVISFSFAAWALTFWLLFCIHFVCFYVVLFCQLRCTDFQLRNTGLSYWQSMIK